ncbi:hypothetical protein BDY19DRAFT_906037 [Irpex rosettiformis]|uniref:Uncharacterized protein n=1 Tax=Irpex rosettiformis TaxID=378272 RepID=A0ACB8U415_9APHY|nr:hypothetical protein BDY19DRAFT_906037 [Irpex rosettiformis]
MQYERPGPLRDLPLEAFTTKTNLSYSHSLPFLRPRIPSNKRPASPERLPDGSPSKRRLLVDERGIVASARTSSLSSVHSAPVATNGLDGRKANVFIEQPQRAKCKETAVDLLWGHNGTTLAKPRRARLTTASSLSSSSTQVHPPLSHNLVSLPEGVVVGTARSTPPDTAHSVNEPQSAIAGHDSGSMHYPGFLIHHDSSVMQASFLSIHDLESLPNRSASFKLASDLDKENMPPAAGLAPPFMLKKKTKPEVSSPFSPVGGSPSLSFHPDHRQCDPVPITPLARRLQSANLTQTSPCTPGPKRSRTGLLGSPFLGPTTPRRTPIGRSERLSLRRQLTDEADGMDLL